MFFFLFELSVTYCILFVMMAVSLFLIKRLFTWKGHAVLYPLLENNRDEKKENISGKQKRIKEL